MRQFTCALATLCLLATSPMYGAGRPEDAGRPSFANRPDFSGRPEAPGRPEDASGRGRSGAFNDARIQQALDSRGGLGAAGFAGSAGANKLSPGPQIGTGRLGRDSQLDRGSLGRDLRDLGDRLFGRDRHRKIHDDRPVTADRRRDAQRRDADRRSERESSRDVAGNADVDDDANEHEHRNRFDAEHRGRPEWARDGISRAERLLARRLAAIDRMRDIALENGNTRLLERADELEELARRQFLMRTEGQKLDWGRYQQAKRDNDGDSPSSEDFVPEIPGDDSTPPDSTPDEPVAETSDETNDFPSSNG